MYPVGTYGLIQKLFLKKHGIAWFGVEMGKKIQGCVLGLMLCLNKILNKGQTSNPSLTFKKSKINSADELMNYIKDLQWSSFEQLHNDSVTIEIYRLWNGEPTIVQSFHVSELPHGRYPWQIQPRNRRSIFVVITLVLDLSKWGSAEPEILQETFDTLVGQRIYRSTLYWNSI